MLLNAALCDYVTREPDPEGRMRIWKMNGAGNAFAVFDARDRSFLPSEEQLREIAQAMKEAMKEAKR